MNWGAPYMLFGTGFAVLFGLILVAGAVRARIAKRRFGDDKRLGALMTYDASKRRAFKGVFLVIAAALAFVAAARPQYGKEKQLVPATKVDIILVVDFSKSMYARDIQPSRISRAKSEVTELIQALPGARFGAVAFAGEAMGFPVTEDGSAVKQFFQSLQPNDMPVGGTAIARALNHAHDLLDRDPKSKDHKRFVILITDGEDLEGSPKNVAASMADEGTTIHVVQIGYATPERIPEIGTDGEMLGWRKTDTGDYMTTQLSERGQQTLKAIAETTPGGHFVESRDGKTGIETLTKELTEALKTGEFVEHYEDVYADVYQYPLGLAILLLLAEAALMDAPRRKFVRTPPPAGNTRRMLPTQRLGAEVPRA
ncbi:MAG: VWA domain-containing protein [Polyangiaceae bacterium]|nr:VWA domain-containing protein [Polyangiaceae bacterium]